MLKFSKVLELSHLNRLHFWAPLKRIQVSETNIELLLACLVGIGAGFATVFFRWLLSQMHHLFFGILWPFLESISPFLLPLIPMLGAVILIPIARRFPGEISGYGMPKFLIAVHLKGGLIRTRDIFVKIFTASLTISSGGSAGVEGPIAQIGGAVGSSIGRFFSMGSHRLKVLIACGSAAGIAAQFNAPLAGVLFAQEIIMIGQFQLQTFGVIVISSGLATAISRAYYSSAPTFGKLSYNLTSAWELLAYILLGLVIGFLGALFIRFFFWVNDRFKNLPLHKNLKPILGAFMVGCLGLISFATLGDGYESIKEAINWHGDEELLFYFALLFILKVIATSITLGSGNVGGLFAPSLFIGAMIGAVFGGGLAMIFPESGITPGSYSLVGMGAFLASTTHAPMTAIFLLFELTNNYQVILPIMFASVIGVMLAKRICEDSLDSLELSRQGIILHMNKEESLLNQIRVEEVMLTEFETLTENMSFAEFMQVFPNSKPNIIPF